MKINYSYLDSIPGWYRDHGREEDVVLSTRVRLARNLSGFKFPGKLELKDENRISRLVTDAFTEADNGFKAVSLESMDSIERRMLAERNIITPEFSLNRNKTLLFTGDYKTVCMVNEQDHIRLIVYRSGLMLKDAYKEINDLDNSLEKELDFAVSLEFGYLNSNIKDSGTGIKFSTMLHLPALAETSMLERAVKSSVTRDFSIKGFMGDEEGSLGDLYQLSNAVSIGSSEEEYLEKIYQVTIKLAEYERQARNELALRRKIAMEDRLYRSLGLIEKCRLLSAAEAVRALADIRLGTALGWVDFDLTAINSLLLLSQKAHIQYLINGNENDSSLVDQARADVVRRSLGISF